MLKLLLTYLAITFSFLLIVWPFKKTVNENRYYQEIFRAVGIGGFSEILKDEKKVELL